MNALWQIVGARGVIALAFAALALWFWIGWGNAADSRDRWKEKAALADQKLAISNQSIATLQGTLSRYVGAGQASRVAQLASIEAQAKDNARLRAQADAIREEMATLTPDGRCETPASILGAEGL